MFPESILLYHENSEDAWEHGIEVSAPTSQKREFIYWAEYQIPTLNARKPFRYTFSENTLELALECLKGMIFRHKDPIAYGIEERITREYEVKIP